MAYPRPKMSEHERRLVSEHMAKEVRENRKKPKEEQRSMDQLYAIVMSKLGISES
jgi:hypothetical protein